LAVLAQLLILLPWPLGVVADHGLDLRRKWWGMHPKGFKAEVILWAVRWYLMFPISYRDLELMLQDRGVEVDHTTLFRWIQAYAPELEKRIRPHYTGAMARGGSMRPRMRTAASSLFY
jgi:hypothetical protein